MNFKEYFKGKITFIFLNILGAVMSATLLSVLSVDFYAIIFIFIITVVCSSLFYIYDFSIKKKYYDEVFDTLEKLDKKYLISEVIKEPSFLEGKIVYELLRQSDKAMSDEVAKYKISTGEYREYIELWVHEIKTPIAASRLIIDNNRNEVTESVEEEIEKVENYIEQVLFYSRSNSVEKDYSIRKIFLKDSINSVIRRNANSFIEKNININLGELNEWVYSDSKWLDFILNQIISNSIKYMEKSNSVLKVYCDNEENDVILRIVDNGIGISEKSLHKVFDKGFTGENGRRFGKSTGIGLYLCKKLCDKLGLGINIKSIEGQGTEVSILFPKNLMIMETLDH
ncbi:MAG: ATP-binding protein [Clostridium sp.]|nr:ATP-binding protein [Clostridium sp.]